MDQKFTVVIADDHPGIRSGITGILESSGDFAVVGEAGDGKEALLLVQRLEPDLLVLDVKLPEMEGPEVAASLSDLELPTIILALSSYDLPEFVENMIQNGARGYLTKDLAPRWLSVAALDLLEDRKKIWVPEKLRKDLELDLG
ncbi:MAG: response regulator transcription factor [Anaerolineales bacterium]